MNLETSLKNLKRHRLAWDRLQQAAFDLNEVVEDYETPIIGRKRHERENFKESCWYKFLQRDLSELNGKDGKLFRNRFTVPYALFLQLLNLANTWFPQKALDVCGREIAPVSLKLLGTLRILGKGCSWDLLYELSGVSAEVHRNWTYKFMEKFTVEMYHIYVHGPRNDDELDKITKLYCASGFPGCVGSTDCVHIRWEMCPSVWRTAFKNGKHTYCSIAYEMTVDHSKRFMATTIGHYGTTSDKTIIKFDGFVQKVKTDDFYVNAEFKLQVGENKWMRERGLYLLVDGGYHKWRIMQCTYKYSCQMIRKDHSGRRRSATRRRSLG